MVDRAGTSSSTTDAWWERHQRDAKTDGGTVTRTAEAASWVDLAAAKAPAEATPLLPTIAGTRLSAEALAHLSGQSPPAARAPLGPEMVPLSKLRTLAQMDAAIAREQGFVSTLGARASNEELSAHVKYLADVTRLRDATGTATERLHSQESRQLDGLRADLAKLGDPTGCREDDTVASLTLRVQALTLAKAQATDEADAERLTMGIDGRAGTRTGMDGYELTQWAAAVNPGSGTGVILAAIATVRGGSLEDVRAAGEAGNQLEDLGGGADHLLQEARRPVGLEHESVRAPGSRAGLDRPNALPIPQGHIPQRVEIRTAAVAQVDDFNAGGTLPTKAMRPDFVGEHLKGNSIWRGKSVEYLSTDMARAPFKLDVREVDVDGKREMRLVDAQGRLFDTRSAATHWSGQSGVPRAIFVMNARGEIFASNFQGRARFHHSSLAGGQDVAAAGELLVIEGRLIEITNQSGHYQPSDEHSDQVVAALRERHLALENVTIVDAAKGSSRRIR